jgi:HSP20 family protein
MVMQQWHPWEDFREMERRMDDMMRHPLMTLRYPLSRWRAPAAEMAWIPALEIYEKEDKFVVKAELPGINKDEIDISITGDTLTVKGERKAESTVKDDDYHRKEIYYGQFSRSVTLPSSVQAEKVAADYNDGILEITLPKSPETKPRKIAVKTKQIEAKVK